MKPDDVPQWAWDEAVRICQILDLDREDDAEEISLALLSAYNRGLEDAAEASDNWKSPSVVKLAAGEMSAQELRTAIAVAGGISSAIRAKIKHGGE